METKTYQLYEITQVKSGCIILGETQSGKTTLVKILQSALNKASGNELKLRMAQERKSRLIHHARRHLSGEADAEAAAEEAKGKKKKKGGRESGMSNKQVSPRDTAGTQGFNSTVGASTAGAGGLGAVGCGPGVPGDGGRWVGGRWLFRQQK